MIKNIQGIFTKNLFRLVSFGYMGYIVIGTIFLTLPCFLRIKSVSILDSLFIATSAVSTTGLVTISISDTYNFFGQFIVMLLIQIGGLGYMTIISFIILSLNEKSFNKVQNINNTVFSLPEHMKVSMPSFLKTVIFFTLGTEFIGAIFLYIFFKNLGINNALWSSIFHSVSAFCTAGFSLYNSSLENFSANLGINLIISILSIFGAIGFIVFYDIFRMFTKKTKMTLTTKIILISTFLIILFASIFIFFFEPAIQGLELKEKILISFFQSINAMTTAGFDSFSISNFSIFSLFIITVLMVIGASPSGTGGGLKTTTFSTIIGVMFSAFFLRNKNDIVILNKKIPDSTVFIALSNLCFYLFFLIFGIFFMSLFNKNFNFQSIFFEVSSALGTVGLSTGITSYLGIFEKILIIFLMYVGRIGPFIFLWEVFKREKYLVDIKKYHTEEDLVI